MKQLAIMFSCVLRSKHVMACLGNRNDDEKGIGWWLVSVYLFSFGHNY